jgi:hypothetical protein
MNMYTRGPWLSPVGQTMNQTGLILIDRRQATSITIVRIYGGANYGSDHCIVQGRYRARMQTRKQPYGKEKEKIHLEQL